jgi:dihydrodipicolinate synthetase family protein
MHGIHVPVVTPFAADGTVDVTSLERLAHHVLEQGAAGLVALRGRRRHHRVRLRGPGCVRLDGGRRTNR